MHYKILDSRVTYKNDRIHNVIVLVDCTGPSSNPLSDVRAIYATRKPHAGYMTIPAAAVLSDQLLQKVAAAGMETVDRDELFPNWQENA